MSDTPPPRRALAPRAADAPEDDATLPRARRLADTPIPPPAPILPTSSLAPEARGRRYSADEPLPEDDCPLPRRSALTPGSALSPLSPTSPASSPPAAPPEDRTDANSSAVVSPTSPADGEATSPAVSRRFNLIAGIVAVASFALVVALFLVPHAARPAPEPTTPPLDDATLLATPTDLAGLRTGTTWHQTTDTAAIEATTPQPKCLFTAEDNAPKPTGGLVRTLASDAGAALHEIDRYASAEDATAAYDARVTQLASCPRTTAWLLNSTAVAGVADAASAATYLLQEATGEYHTLLVARTGKDVQLLDLAGKEPWGMDAAVAAWSLISQRHCAATGGPCPTTPQLTQQVPPAVPPAGWLASVDLPRLTGGAGTWRGTDIAPMKLSGSACEAIDLTAVAGATASAQRTYLLYDDTRAKAVGVDEAIYTFGTPEEAAGLLSKLAANMDGCPGRTATATVRRVGDVAALGGGTGASWFVTQKVTGDQTAHFRVSVLAVGKRVGYVFANPADGVDFSDADWQAVATRAGGRITQLP